ncbi:MAG: 16S rRNA (guanine(966)-N(2))-methyltransferase RsmD [Planctomycetota bacterium]
MASRGAVRISGGSLRGRTIDVPQSLGVRPMRTRIREALFQIIVDWLPKARFLDVFSGSGAIGVEAISRGAVRTTFIENNRKVAAILQRNLDALSLRALTEILQVDPYTTPISGGPFDVIFLDPPFPHYEPEDPHDPWELALQLAASDHLASDGLIGLEYPRYLRPPAPPAGCEEFLVRRYGDTSLALWRKSGAGA